MNKNIIIKDTARLCGKGAENPELFLKCDAVSIHQAFGIDYSEYNKVIFHINEDITTVMDDFKKLANLIRKEYNNIVIYNNPAICDIGNKYETFNHIMKNGGILGAKIPHFYKITRLEDLDNVIHYPCILKLPKNSHPSGDFCDHFAIDKFELVHGFKRLIKYNEFLLCVEFIDSKDELNLYNSLRLHMINNHLIDYFCRPSFQWNIHTRDQEIEMMLLYDQKFKKWMNNNPLNNLLNDIVRLFGHGWYVADFIWVGNELYLSEIGYKLFNRISNKINKKINLNKKTKCKNDVFSFIKEIIDT